MFRSLQKVNAVGLCTDCTAGQDYCTNEAGCSSVSPAHPLSCRDVPQELDTWFLLQLSRKSPKPHGPSQPAAHRVPHPQRGPGVSAGWSSPAMAPWGGGRGGCAPPLCPHEVAVNYG